MAKTHGWSDFEKLLLDEAGNHIRKLGPQLRDDLAEALKEDLFGDEPAPPIRNKYTKDDYYLSKVFWGYREVGSCVERLKDIPIYLRSFPYRSKELDKNRYLRYHIESYFYEIFILRERLTAYLKRIGRGFRGDRRHSEILAATRPLFASVTGTLTSVSNTRNAHVHQSRFDSSDLSRLDTIQLVSRIDEFSENIKEFYDMEYRLTRDEWRSRFDSNNAAVGKLLDQIADRIVPLVFNLRRKRLKYPRQTAA